MRIRLDIGYRIITIRQLLEKCERYDQGPPCISIEDVQDTLHHILCAFFIKRYGKDVPNHVFYSEIEKKHILEGYRWDDMVKIPNDK